MTHPSYSVVLSASFRRLLTLALIGLFLPSSSAWAGGFSISILGGRRTGALTNLAAPDDLTALFHNPAGLADQPGLRVHVSGSMTFMDTSFRMQALDPRLFPELYPTGKCAGPATDDCPWPVDDEGYYESEIQPESYFGVLPYLGLSQDLGFASPRLRQLVVSMAVTAPNLYGATLPENAPTAYNFTEGFFATISATIGAGYRVNRYLALGLSLSYNYMKLTYAQKFSTTDLLSGQVDASTLRLAQTLIKDILLDYSGVDHGLGWNLGVLVHATPDLSFGFSYNGATPARFEGDLSFSSTNPNITDLRQTIRSLGSLLPEPIKLPTRLAVEMPIPHSLQAGVNLRLTRWLEVGLDFRLWLYTLYEEQVLEPLYDPDEIGREPLTREDLSKDKDYSLSYEVALGLVARPLPRWLPGLEAMAGIGFDKSPVPGKSFSLDNPSMNQLVGAVGLRFQAVSWLRLSASYMIDWYMPRDIRKSEASPPMNVQGEALGHMPRLELEFLL